MDLPALLAKYDTPVPRYTSYPTAPHFTATVTQADYRAWLTALPAHDPVSLYLHVPFCEELCLYCGCNSHVVRGTAPRTAYAEALAQEIETVADLVGVVLPVSHIHWGGGTPTALAAESLTHIMALLRRRFIVLPDAEIAIELDPRHTTADRLAAFPAMGITRASLGVQDFSAEVQHAIGRIQSYETTARIADAVRAQGVTSLNVDLMYGLPRQTERSVTRTARQALGLAPDRAAVFGYAHVPWVKRHQALIPAESLPDGAARYAQMAAIEAVFSGAGYTAIGLDHFARPDDRLAQAAAAGELRRNFQGYTTDTAATMLAFGASAISALPQGYVQNATATPDYLRAVRSGQLPVARGIARTGEDALRADIIMRLMSAGSADLPGIAASHHADLGTLAAAGPALAALAADGIIHWDGAILEVRPEGRRFVRNVAAVFDAYLSKGSAGHSRAV